MNAITPYTTKARETNRDLRNIIAKFGDGTTITAVDMDDFDEQWEKSGYPTSLKSVTSNGFDAAMYPTVLALGAISAVLLSAKAKSPVFKGEGMTCRDTQQAKDLLRELSKEHASRGSELYSRKNMLKAFTWTGKVYENDRATRNRG